jgi:hypothetical protein
MTTAVKAFYAYATHPQNVVDAIHSAVEELNASHNVAITIWESLRIGGRLVIDSITHAIDDSQLVMVDVTGLNPNVMFELGYAIATRKRVWITSDSTWSDHKKAFDQLRLLTTIGYRPSTNSRALIDAFYTDTPYSNTGESFFSRHIEKQLKAVTSTPVFYLRSMHENQAGAQITTRISTRYKSGSSLITDDPREASFQTLGWYAQQVYSSRAVVCHLSNPKREGTGSHIARQALVCGMAYGLRKPLLLLTEGDYLTPLDYRDLCCHYDTAKAAVDHLDAWLDQQAPAIGASGGTSRSSSAVELATELRGLHLGEYVAENEAEALVENYFVETAAYREAIAGTHAIFVGRKGSGKTANFLKLSQELGEKRDVLVVVIKPPAYELQGLLELFEQFSERDTKGYLIESLWKFLLLTEVAIAALREFDKGDVRAWHDSAEDFESLRVLGQRYPKIFESEFAIRLEQCVTELLDKGRSLEGNRTKEETRKAVSEVLHQGVIRDLKVALGSGLLRKKRVAILVDNLDKAWDKEANIPELGRFLLGLLTAAGRLPSELRVQNSRLKGVDCSLAVFLRSDIFYKVMRDAAPEPDKIRFHKLSWNDRSLLLRVIDERLIASRHGASADQIWRRCFCREVRGLPLKEYIAKHIIARPRDIVFLIKAAVEIALNRNHGIVQADDIIDAEKQYSQYAFESILVENGISVSTLENVLFEFVGSEATATENAVRACICRAIPEQGRIEAVMAHLCSLTFLGIEDSSDFRFSDDPEECRKNLILGRKIAQARGRELRFQVHPAFRAYLDIS